MPNHCGSTLFLVAPTAVLDDILDTMEGPIDWFFPEGMIHSPGETHALLSGKATEHTVSTQDFGQGTAHITLRLQDALQRALSERTLEDWRAERDRRLGWPQPNWLPLTHACIARMVSDPAWPEAIPLAPLSMPKLLEKLGDVEPTLTSIAGDLTEYGQSWLLDRQRVDVIVPLRMALVGTKWGIYDPTFDRDEDVYVLPETGWSAAVLRYTTAWGPLSSLESALTPLLEGCDARALLVWDDEGGTHGYEFFHPDGNGSSGGEIEISSPEEPEEGADDDDGAFDALMEAYWEEKPRLLLEHASDAVDDTLTTAAVHAFIDAHWDDAPPSADG